jgi:hypothetical protein
MDEHSREAVRRAVEGALHSAPELHGMPDDTKRSLAASLGSIAEALAPEVPGPLVQQQPQQPTPATTPAPAPADGSSSSGGGAASPTGRAGEVARATLNAIDFPSFVASLIQGTFKAIVDASIQQMQAYAELLANVAKTVDQFMNDNVTDGQVKDYLADEHPNVFTTDTSSGAPVLKVNQNGNAPQQLPSFLQDLGFQAPQDISNDDIDNTIVPATKRSLAEQRQQTLSTMVLMGINRVVVDDGEILAKLMFHIDASETTSLKFDQTKTTVGNMAQTAGNSQFTAQGLMVNTTSLNAQSDINVRADLTGQVSVKFRSETFPLERFADSAAIQLINQNAKVPPPAPAPAPGTAVTQPPASPPPAQAPSIPAATAAAPQQQPAAAPATAAQGLEADPWLPVGAKA